MKIIEIALKAKQYLCSVLNPIRPNTIVNKTVTGIGATRSEIDAPRHSIIIVPNVPVIVGKEKKHSFVLGVYENVTGKHVEKYLNDYADDGYYKIITTPESFGKVKWAIRKTGMNLYKDFFVLFDECEKLIQDVGYRKNICLPMEDFFRCENKAMVSATPIMPSDPRFEHHGFEVDKIVPDYDYRRVLYLYPTNNVLATLCRAIDTIREKSKSLPICIFFNSTDCIEKYVNVLNIKDQTNIYCAKDSVDKLKSRGFKQVYDTFSHDKDGNVELNLYNFFTCRFNSAVDIDLAYKPAVIMVTELFSVPHSTIDPFTEAIQIPGRFRNGITVLSHITNYDRRIEYKDRETLSAYLDGQHSMYGQLRAMRLEAKTDGERDLLDQALQTVDYAKYVLPNGEKNYFMYDHAFREHFVKSLYQSPSALCQAYRESGAFDVRFEYVKSALSDKERDILNERRGKKVDLNRLAFKVLKNIIESQDKYDKPYLDEFGKSYAVVLEAYHELGEEKVKQIGFKNADLKKAIAEKKAYQGFHDIGVVTAVHNAFEENSLYTTKYINEVLGGIFTTFDIQVQRNGIAPKIQLYFDVSPQNTAKAKGWKLGRRLSF